MSLRPCIRVFNYLEGDNVTAEEQIRVRVQSKHPDAAVLLCCWRQQFNRGLVICLKGAMCWNVSGLYCEQVTEGEIERARVRDIYRDRERKRERERERAAEQAREQHLH